MTDIDLLIRDKDAQATVRLLESCGYEAASASRRHMVFRPPRISKGMSGRLGEHIDNPSRSTCMPGSRNASIETVDITQFALRHNTRTELSENPPRSPAQPVFG